MEYEPSLIVVNEAAFSLNNLRPQNKYGHQSAAATWQAFSEAFTRTVDGQARPYSKEPSNHVELPIRVVLGSHYADSQQS